MDPSVPAWLQVFLDTPAESFEPAVEFWSAVTGWTPSERRGEGGQFLTLQPTRGSSSLKMQAVDGPAGIHLDLDSRDRPGVVRRASDLGARPAWTYQDVEVMRTPGGLLHCHTLLDGDPSLPRDGATIVDQVCIDVPRTHWESEVTFWRELTGRGFHESAPGYARLDADGQVRILLQRLDDEDGPVRAHPDLASADREGDVRRHVGLGAHVVATHDRWTVLLAPGGQVYCVTDRDPATGLLPPLRR